MSAFEPLIFCMNCGHILGPDKHHLDCPTRKGRVYDNGKWVKAPPAGTVEEPKLPKEPWREAGIWLRHDGHSYVVAIERNGKWIDVIRDSGACSPIIEVSGIENRIGAAEALP